MTTKETHRDRISREIADQMLKGTAPWVRPWGSRTIGVPKNPLTGTLYRGFNFLMLSACGGGANFATWKQIHEKGGTVKPGSEALPILFFSPLPGGRKASEGADEGEGEGGGRAPFVLKTFMVFCLETCTTGLESLLPAPPPMRPEIERHEHADRLLSAWDRALKGGIRHGGGRAYYSPAADGIVLPEQRAFTDDPSYFGTALHEIAHATGAPSRLDRKFGKRFGDRAYAFEELVAELTAAFLCAEIGIDGRLQHAEYLATWADVLRDDSGAFLRACGLAQKAADRALAELGTGASVLPAAAE